MASPGELIWTLALALAWIASSYLTYEAWLDYAVTRRAKLDGLRRLVSIEAVSNFAIQWGTLALLTGIAASSLFVPEPADPLTTRQIVIRWAFVAWAAAIVVNQLVGSYRRRRMTLFARVRSRIDASGDLA